VHDGAVAVDDDQPATRGDLRALEQRITGDMRALEQRITGDAKAVEERLTGDVRALTGDVRALAGDVSVLTGDVRVLTGDVRALTGDVRAVEQRVEGIAGDLAGLEERLAVGLTNVIRTVVREETQHAVAIQAEQFRTWLGAVDEKYRDLPGRTAALDAKLDEHARDFALHKRPPAPAPRTRRSRTK
jgi:hypothetical protein